MANRKTNPAASQDESWFRKLAETSSTAIFVFRLDCFLYVNPAGEELTGYRAEELLQLPPTVLVAEEMRAELTERVRARLDGQTVPSHFEMPIVCKDGTRRWADYSASVIELPEGRAVLASAIDLSQRKLAELALGQSEQRLLLAQRAGRCVTWEWEVAGDQLTVSEYAQELFGLGPGELNGPGRNLFQRFHHRDRELLRQATLRTFKEDADFVAELPLVNPSGELHWVLAQGQAMRGENGRVQRLVGVASDVTEHRRGAERLRLIVDGTSAVTGEDFFRCLVRYLAQALEVRYAFVTEFTDASCQRARLLSAWTGTDYVTSQAEYDLEGTPAEGIADGDLIAYSQGVRELFPDEHCLRDEQAEAFLAVPLFDSAEQPLGYMGVIHDRPLREDVPADSILRIFAARAGVELERMRAEGALFEEKERAQVTLASIGDGVIRTDAHERIDFLNPAAEKLTGWSAEEAYGRLVSEVYTPLDEATRQPLPDPVTPCLRNEPVPFLPGRKLLVSRDGSECSVRESVAPIHDQLGVVSGAVLVIRDVSELRGMERQMHHLASHDRITGLINRHEFENRLRQALSSARLEGRHHVLCYLDMDEFKVVNDTGGHVAGDKMLQQVAELLGKRVREGDTLARLGGDEFGVLLEDCSLGQARILAEAMRADIAELRFQWEGHSFRGSASIGMVPITADQASVTELMSAVDSACYVAKEGGGNRLHGYRLGDTSLAERHGEMQWIQRLRHALDEDRFCLFAQPIRPIAVTNGNQLQLNEIFVRLIDEQGQIVAPGAFIPAAERYRLISAIDRWVVRATLRWMVRSGTNLDGRDRWQLVSINVSGQSLSEESFLEDIVSELKDSGVNPERLCFEITETAAIGNFGRATLFFSVLRDMGCRFALDDFGSGLSSFAYLKSLPVDFLKIDGEFVRSLGRDPSRIHRTLIEAMHHVGEVLGIRTIAEYVENEAIYRILEQIGIDYAQGYWIGRPMPVEQL